MHPVILPTETGDGLGPEGLWDLPILFSDPSTEPLEQGGSFSTLEEGGEFSPLALPLLPQKEMAPFEDFRCISVCVCVRVCYREREREREKHRET